jgi:hypothetical protein
VRAWLTFAAVLAAAASTADVLFLKNGDRVTGTVLSEGARGFTLQTPFGRLSIPREEVAKVQRADGREDVVNAAAIPPAEKPAAAPSPTPAPSPRVLVPASPSPSTATGTSAGTGVWTPVSGPPSQARLGLIITGSTFWQAWPPKEAPADPSLRFVVTLEDTPVATYRDAKLDAGEINGALVNTFSFLPGDVTVHFEAGRAALAPETRPGRIVLRMDVPATGGTRHLRIAYQDNPGSAQEPSWRDLAAASAEITLAGGGFTFVQVRQDRGNMEFGGFPRRRMKNVESFRLEILTDGETSDRP